MVDRSIRPHRCPRQTSLVGEQEIPSDPLLGLKAPKLDTAVSEPLTTDQLKVPAPRVEVIEADRIEHDGTGRHTPHVSLPAALARILGERQGRGLRVQLGCPDRTTGGAYVG